MLRLLPWAMRFSKNRKLVKLAEQQQLQAREFQKMAEAAKNEAMIQRVLAEEQLKALKSK